MLSVYKITNLINKKSYIGSSVCPERRWKEHINYSKNPNNPNYNYPLYKAIRKYGLENFSFEIIQTNFSSIEEMQEAEQYWIHYYNSVNEGYNQTYLTKPSEMTFENCSESREKQKSRCAKVDEKENIIEIYESYHDAARKNNCVGNESNIRLACKGIKSSFNGDYYRDLDLNSKVISIPFKPYKNRKRIIGINVDRTQDDVIFESILEASNVMQISRSSIQKCISGSNRYSIVGGYIWRTFDENGIIQNNIDIKFLQDYFDEHNPIINGVRKNITEWVNFYGISRNTYYKRRQSGMSIIDALSTPKRR